MKEEKITKKIKIIVAERKTRDGKPFKSYKTTSKNGRLMDVKFRKEVKNLPDATCYATIAVDLMNIDKNREYPVLWIAGEVESYTAIADNNIEANRKAIDEFFGE